ncbi:hypothetical protein C8R44DRAFT_888816 [Mycena epipterygia]|nr:hypothetical protein C8R44DRAFT_888816 [Mycena epipterygia]
MAPTFLPTYFQDLYDSVRPFKLARLPSKPTLSHPPFLLLQDCPLPRGNRLPRWRLHRVRVRIRRIDIFRPNARCNNRLATNEGAAIYDPLIHQPPLPVSNPTPEQVILRCMPPDIIPSRVSRCLSEWISVLQKRGTVPDSSLGSMMGGIQTFEIHLAIYPFTLILPHSPLEQILITALPLYVPPFFPSIFVPCPTVRNSLLLTSFVLPSRITASYDNNNVDLNMFCREIIRQDLQSLKKALCQNARFKMRGPPPPSSPSITGRPITAAPAEQSHLSPESTSNAGSMHGHGGNMFRASLASLSDPASTQGELETETEGDIEFNCRTSNLRCQ